MQPDTHEKAGPLAGTGDLETIALTGDNSNSSESQRFVDEAWSQFVGGLMQQTSAAAGDLLLPDWVLGSAAATTGMIYRAICQAIDAGLDPTPLAVSDRLRHDPNFAALPGFSRAETVGHVHQLFGDAPGTFHMTGHARGLVIESAAWARAVQQVSRVTEGFTAGWTLADLDDLLKHEFGGSPTYVTEAIEVTR